MRSPKDEINVVKGILALLLFPVAHFKPTEIIFLLQITSPAEFWLSQRVKTNIIYIYIFLSHKDYFRLRLARQAYIPSNQIFSHPLVLPPILQADRLLLSF